MLGRRELTKGTKLVVNAMVLPTLKYDCEGWTLQKTQGKKGGYTDEGIKMDRGVTRLDKKRNMGIRDRLKQD